MAAWRRLRISHGARLPRKQMTSTKKYLQVFEPEIAVTLSYLLFLTLAALSYIIPDTRIYLLKSFQTPPTAAAYGTTLLGLGVFIAAVRLGKKINFTYHKPVLLGIVICASAVIYLTLEIPLILAVIMALAFAALLYYLSAQKDFHRLTGIVFLLALLSALSILLRGIPILSASAREATAVSTSRALFHGTGVFAGALLIGFYDRKKAALAISAMAVVGLLSGFKSDAIAIILSATIAGLLLGKISLRAMTLTAAAIVFILTGVSTFIALIAHGVWNIPPFLYPIYRFGFTFSVYSKIVETSLPLGSLHGQAILSTTQEIMSTAVLGYTKPHIITSTLFGPLTLDFGLVGLIITAVFIGLYLGLLKRDTTLRTCLYAMALTHVLVIIEVGLQLTSIMFLFSMMYLSIREKTGHD
ncbi:MAG TPA: hypothetical protein ENH51_04275 [Euryarchaeota archaeon]|nr:hypothetical protein [Euryarchaeota archaeon]